MDGQVTRSGVAKGPAGPSALSVPWDETPWQLTCWPRRPGDADTWPPTSLAGFGIDVKDPSRWGDEDDARICGHEMSAGAEDGGRTAMERLLQKCPDINVVYTINEPAAAGVWEAIRAAGRDDGSIIMVSFDGGCPGVKNVRDGVIGATTQQYPLLMASMALEAIKAFKDTGARPEVTPGLTFFNTGTTLVTDKPVDGVESIDTAKGLELCWG
jgi:fructose transport system substrate-binding protein